MSAKVLAEGMPARELICYELATQLKQTELQNDFLRGRGYNPTVFCSNLAIMIEEQGRGEHGYLATHKPNIFQAYNDANSPVIVVVTWSGHKWTIESWKCDKDYQFPLGTQIFV